MSFFLTICRDPYVALGFAGSTKKTIAHYTIVYSVTHSDLDLGGKT